MVREIWLWLKEWDMARVALYGGDTASDYVADEMWRIVGRVVSGEPLQHVLGEAHFYGLTLKVTPDVLVPRPETAQMVDMIVDRFGRTDDMLVLDLATGSGCIAVALAMNLPFSHVTAVDISEAALKIARENAARYKVPVNFRRGDILAGNGFASGEKWNVIVSNPPYIAQREAASMEKRVLDYEPHTALFVPDDDPLCFYREIGRGALETLLPGGTLYFEINPLFAKELRSMLISQGWDNVELVKDSFGKVRFAVVTK